MQLALNVPSDEEFDALIKRTRHGGSLTMQPTTDWRDAERFAGLITAAGGRVPDALQHMPIRPRPARVSSARTATGNRHPDACAGWHAGRQDVGEIGPDRGQRGEYRCLPQMACPGQRTHLLGEFHRQVKAGADEILDSLRNRFEEHAVAIEHRRHRSTRNPAPSTSWPPLSPA
jgi:hypothetical protein